MKGYKRLTCKQFAQISGLCGPQFPSYLPKHFTHLCRTLYGDAIFCPPMAAGNQQKHLKTRTISNTSIFSFFFSTLVRIRPEIIFNDVLNIKEASLENKDFFKRVNR